MVPSLLRLLSDLVNFLWVMSIASFASCVVSCLYISHTLINLINIKFGTTMNSRGQ